MRNQCMLPLSSRHLSTGLWFIDTRVQTCLILGCKPILCKDEIILYVYLDAELFQNQKKDISFLKDALLFYDK